MFCTIFTKQLINHPPSSLTRMRSMSLRTRCSGLRRPTVAKASKESLESRKCVPKKHLRREKGKTETCGKRNLRKKHVLNTYLRIFFVWTISTKQRINHPPSFLTRTRRMSLRTRCSGLRRPTVAKTSKELLESRTCAKSKHLAPQNAKRINLRKNNLREKTTRKQQFVCAVFWYSVLHNFHKTA